MGTHSWSRRQPGGRKIPERNDRSLPRRFHQAVSERMLRERRSLTYPTAKVRIPVVLIARFAQFPGLRQMMKFLRFRRLPVVALAFAVLLPSAFAKGAADYTQFGHDIRIATDQKVGELTCFNCSVYVHGQVNGDITTFHGNIVIEQNAAVSGEVTSFLGQIHAATGSKIGGDATVFGGNLVLEQDGMLNGEATSFAGDIRVANGAKIGGDSTAIGGVVRRQAGAM